MSQLSINGDIQSGQDVRAANVVAVCALANIVKSSLGPVGLDKMLVDGVGDVTISNDGMCIHIMTDTCSWCGARCVVCQLTGATASGGRRRLAIE